MSTFKRDQKFFDLYSLTLGILALVGLAIFVFAARVSDMTQGLYTADAEEYQQQVAERLRPIGQVFLPGEEQTANAPQVTTVAASEPVATTLSGPQVYNEACLACHGAGIAGAPMLTDAENWAPRIAQGLETLRSHAIQGYNGSAGYMPPKGGRLDLSDDEIYAAIDYMIGEVPQ
ncbi:MAG: c-type cytochrome [Pseudomonadota bacterium]